MNKEEKLDGIKVGYTLEYTLYLYFTGLKPFELGFVLYEDRSVVKKGIIGLITQDKFMDKIWVSIVDRFGCQKSKETFASLFFISLHTLGLCHG